MPVPHLKFEDKSMDILHKLLINDPYHYYKSINYVNVHYEIYVPNFTNLGGLYDLLTAMQIFLNWEKAA